jgi:hypothetical protein
MASFLVLSDIHLVRHQRAFSDVDTELRTGLLNFLPTLKSKIGDFAAIFVCGDIAYHAHDNQYAAASGFLRDIQARIGPIRILTVPGNHDINREETRSPDQRHWRSRTRRSGLDADQRDAALVSLLEDDQSGPGLFTPLAAYNRFAGNYGCVVSEEHPFWTTTLAIDDRYTLAVRGLTSVLISDEHDDNDLLQIGDIQTSDMAATDGVLNITLSHHPYTWLFDGERQRDRIRHRGVLHVTGHDHKHDVLVDDDNHSLHLCLGALQPTRNATWEPRLYGLNITVAEKGTRAVADIHVISAKWVRHNDSFVVDFNKHYKVPIAKAPASPSPGTEPPAAQTVLLLQWLAALPSGDRMTAGRSIGADLSELVVGEMSQFPERLVEWAAEEGLLHQLWEEVKRLHGGQITDANPF